jgi:hypothetical protein
MTKEFHQNQQQQSPQQTKHQQPQLARAAYQELRGQDHHQ